MLAAMMESQRQFMSTILSGQQQNVPKSPQPELSDMGSEQLLGMLVKTENDEEKITIQRILANASKLRTRLKSRMLLKAYQSYHQNSLQPQVMHPKGENPFVKSWRGLVQASAEVLSLCKQSRTLQDNRAKRVKLGSIPHPLG
jgi:hypothetical protein